MEGGTAEERGEQKGEVCKAKGRGAPMRGESDCKEKRKNIGMSSETINTCMFERERGGGYFQPVVVMETEASTDADVQCSQMFST